MKLLQLYLGMNVHQHRAHYVNDTDSRTKSYQQIYAQHMKLFVPELEKLSLAGVGVVWMMSQPTLDLAYFLEKAEGNEENFAHSEKVHQFNQFVLPILKVLSPTNFCFNILK